MTVKGTVFKYGNDVDTDVIIPARYLNTTSETELASHCMEDIDKEFVKKVKKGDIMVAQDNFGCGSSREHAPIAIKASGIDLVIANSFARIFYRNSINIGLPILECPEAVQSGRCGFLRSFQRRDRKRNNGSEIPGRTFPRIYSEHYRQRRPDQIHQSGQLITAVSADKTIL